MVAGPIDWQHELDRHDRWLRTVIWSRLRHAHSVDEVMQEVALAAVRQQAPISDASRVSAWLYRLAITQSLLYRRRLGRQRRLQDRYAQRLQTSSEDRGEPDPLGWLLSQERRAMVRQALGSLASRDAEVLLLKYAENLSYQKMAELLEISTAAVESRLHRAREKLRTALAAMHIAEVES
ncbi:MAG: sigma-70 family RNA polymerase sigma factor [Planctomycetes bacterium]|nr:sigma-70 family RNA polymerase sigma factor [Planctomycetota bacterium]